jgi:hypothetical protein
LEWPRSLPLSPCHKYAARKGKTGWKVILKIL